MRYRKVDPMRVAYLTNSHPRVSQTFIRREIRELERQGVEVTRFALRGWENHVVDPQDVLERDRTHYVLQRGTMPLIWATLWMLVSDPARVCRAIALTCRVGWRADRPLAIHFIYLAEACLIARWMIEKDLKHLHVHFGTNPATVAMLVGILAKISWSFTVHGPEEFDRPELISLAEKVRHCRFVVAISSFGRSQLYRLVDHCHWHKIKLVRCGVGSEFLAAALVPIEAPPRLVCVGRLCAQKGQLLLLDAANRLAKKGVQFELVLAGDGELRSEVERLISKYTLESHVRVTGWLSSDQVVHEIISARALVLPSFAEGLPIVIMEAMALGRPVISTFIAGIPELVTPEEHGDLVPAGDIDALATAMERYILQSPAQLSSLGESTRARVSERHSLSRECAILVQLFSAVV